MTKNQAPRLRDPSIDQKMKDLSNIYSMCNKTAGQDKQMWEVKWYDMVNQIAEEIRRMGQKSGTEDTF